MAISWLALRKAVIRAANATRAGKEAGEELPRPKMLMTSKSCIDIIQPRLLPSQGGLNLSMSGAHRTLSAYGSLTSEKMPIMLRSTFSVMSQA